MSLAGVLVKGKTGFITNIIHSPELLHREVRASLEAVVSPSLMFGGPKGWGDVRNLGRPRAAADLLSFKSFLSLCYRTMGGCGFSSWESGPGEEVGVPGEAADG